MDVIYPWLHEYQEIYLDDGKEIQIYYDALDDSTLFYLTIKDKGKTLIEKEYIWIGSIPSFSIVHSPSYEVVGIIKYGHRPYEVIAFFDFESKEFWAAKNDVHDNEELGQKLLTNSIVVF